MTPIFRSLFLVIPLSVQMLAQAPATATPEMATPSAILKPALDSIQQTLIGLRPEKWKVSNAIGQQTQGNIVSITTDLQTTLPPLLAVADAHPDSAAQVLPTFRNVTALYDVLLRITQVATIAAPAPQSAALQQSLASLETGRHDLGDRLQASALTQTQQIHDLQAQLHSLQSAPAPVATCPPPPPPPTPAKKRKPRPKPVTPAAAAPQVSAPAHQ
jgi:hypothetical protein